MVCLIFDVILIFRLNFSQSVTMPELSEEEIQSLYMWIDEIPLSKPKKNITRDFSDGGKFNEKA